MLRDKRKGLFKGITIENAVIDVGYFSPFVPPEWIAAHGLRPVWLRLDRTRAHTGDVAKRGICPCAGTLISQAASGSTPRVLVLTTSCDQMRYAFAYLGTVTDLPAFLMNIPSTWQSSQVREFYRNELERMGRFLVQAGGREPTSEQVLAIVEQYDAQRASAFESRSRMSAGQWAQTLVELRGDLATNIVETEPPPADEGIPLALIGGPLLADDDSFLEMVECAGGRIVVDATEGGERTMPARVDRSHLKDDPMDELVRMYFDTIPDVFRRPNTRLYQWLGNQVSAWAVRGIILRRYPFCDLWHAELHRLRQSIDMPVLDIDVGVSDGGEESRTLGRIEAFLEMLR